MSPLRKGELDLAARPDDLVGRAFGEPESSPAFGMASDSSLRITFLILDEKESMHQILDCKFIDGTNAQTFGVPKTASPVAIMSTGRALKACQLFVCVSD